MKKTNPEIEQLYQKLIASWNQRNAEKFASYFVDNASVVGFDGSQLNGKPEIFSTLDSIFSQHPTAPYTTIVKEIRMLSEEIGLLRSAVGMVPVGQTQISPGVNAIQSMVAIFVEGEWKIALFQNTPASFHGRPELVQKMTAELQNAYNSNRADLN